MTLLHPPFLDLAVASFLGLAGLVLSAVLRWRRSRFWGPAVVATVLFIAVATGALYPRSQVFGYALWRGSRAVHDVALTFDDGPDSRFTPQILAILARENVHATFFMVGANVVKHPQIARRVADEGHAIGNHTFTHPDLIVAAPRRVRSEIERTEQAILRATGIRTDLFRPPYGFRTPVVYRQLQRDGLRMVEWTLTSQDWRNRGPAKICQRVLRRVRPGSIILFHDGRGNRSDTVAALPTIIRALKGRGYRLVTIPELLSDGSPPR
jgi:peptidoglycan/xylan/chitin deacetylase (PgdA/CDA1 family)